MAVVVTPVVEERIRDIVIECERRWEHYPRWPQGWCHFATNELANDLAVDGIPPLERVRGFFNMNSHEWLVAEDGTIVDPTAGQFTSADALAIVHPGQPLHDAYHATIKDAQAAPYVNPRQAIDVVGQIPVG